MRRALEKFVFTSRILAAVKAHLERRGVDWAGVARQLGFDPSIPTGDETWVPFDLVLQVHEHAAKVPEDDSAGLAISRAAPIGMGGAFEYVCLSAPTVRTGLSNLIRFHRIPTNAFALTLHETAGHVYVEWRIDDVFGPRAQFVGNVMGFMATRVRSMLGDGELDFDVQLSHAPPANADAFTEFFGASVRFNQPHDRLGVSRCRRPPAHASEPHLYGLLVDSALLQLKKREKETDQVFQVTRYLSEGMRDGDITLDSVARKMAVSGRTLQRTLASSGTNFRELVDKTRQSIALRYLTETEMPIKEIAFLTGFADQSAFTRAFSNWTGMPPRDFRASQEAGRVN